jgi:hypothetical protein
MPVVPCHWFAERYAVMVWCRKPLLAIVGSLLFLTGCGQTGSVTTPQFEDTLADQDAGSAVQIEVSARDLHVGGPPLADAGPPSRSLDAGAESGTRMPDSAVATPSYSDAALEVAGATKWHPGHYMKSQANDRRSAFDRIFDQPYLLGAMVQYNWRELEPSYGVYDFSRIEEDLAHLSSRRKRLIIKFDDRDFGADSANLVVPDYLLTDEVYGGGAEPTKNGWAAAIWREAVMDREILLLQRLGARFDDEPYVEMLTTQETAPGWAGDQPSDWNADDYYAQIARMQREVKAYWPTTLCLQGVNHANTAGSELGRDEMMSLILRSAFDAGWGVMEPDSVIENRTDAQRMFLESYVDRMPHGTTASNLVLNPDRESVSPQDAFRFGVYTERVNYFTWISPYLDEAVGTIVEHDGDINPICPENVLECRSD